jgi:calcium-dependent protein kinase
MLTYNPEERISAEDALNDIWIMKFATREPIELNTMLGSMNSMQEFNVKSGLQKAVLSYASGHFMAEEQEKKAREVFEMLDVNGDGQLSREELLEAYKIILDDVNEAKAYVDKVMNQLDMNNNGTIDYKEFLVANFQKSNALNLRMLRQAFDFFDEVI